MRYSFHKRVLHIAGLLFFAVFSRHPADAQGAWTHWTNSTEIENMMLQGDYLWMRMNESLIRYNTLDGGFSRYTMEDGLPSRTVRPLASDESGMVWAGAQNSHTAHFNKVCLFDGLGWRTVEMPDTMRVHYPLSGMIDRAGNLWVNFVSNMCRYDGARWSSWHLGPGPIRAHIEDAKNRLWAGTDEGIYSFDGSSWGKRFPYPCYAILSAGGDTLWAGSDEEVLRFDGATWERWRVAEERSGKRVLSLLRDSRGHIWAGTGEGVSRFDGVAWTHWKAAEGMAQEIKYLVEDSRGNIWAAAQTSAYQPRDNGVYQYDGTAWKHWSTENLLAGNAIFGIVEDRRGTVWVGTNRGICGYRNGVWNTWQWLPNAERSGQVFSVFDDGDGHIWASFKTGVSRFDGHQWEMLMDYPLYMVAAVTPAAPFIRDSAEKVWVGLSFRGYSDGDAPFGLGGMSRYESPGWTRYTLKTLDFMPGFVRAFLVDHNGFLWAGMEGGIARFENERWNPLHSADGPFRIYSLLQDRHGTVWASGENGVYRYDGNLWKTYNASEGLAPGTVASLLEDAQGTIWALFTYHGLSRFNGERWSEVTDLPDTSAICMMLDHEDRIWVGSAGGISCLDGDRRTTWTTGAALGPGCVAVLAADGDNRIWAGLRPAVDDRGWESGGGVSRFDGERWQTWTAADGLPSNYTTCITVDGNNDVWIGSQAGISRFSERVSSVAESPLKPMNIQISSIRPNPFNASAAISFSLPRAGKVTLSVYDITGRKVRELISQTMPAGAHTAVWDGRDGMGRMVSSGVYLPCLNMEGYTAAGRMVLLK